MVNSSASWNRLDQMPPGRAFEVWHLTDTVTQPRVFHSHEYYEIYFFLRGHTRVIIEDVDISPSRGDVLIFPPHCMHRNIHLDSGEPYERFYLYATREFLQAVSGEGFDLLGELDALLSGGCHFRLKDAALEELLRLTEEVIAAAGNASPAERLMNRHRMGMLLVRALMHLRAVGESAPVSVLSPMGEVVRYLSEHVTEPVTLEELEHVFFMSRYALLRQFREHTGMTIHQYLLTKRVLLAQELLAQGLKPNQVGERCGFADYTSFYRAFRSRTGMSPAQYGRG